MMSVMAAVVIANEDGWTRNFRYALINITRYRTGPNKWRLDSIQREGRLR